MTTINREKFLHTLESVQPGLSSKDLISQGKSLIFQRGRVKAFNEELYCSAPTGLPKEYTGAVVAEKLLEMLRKFDDEELDCEFTESRLTFKRKQGASSWHNLDAEIALPVDLVEKPGEWQPLHTDFGEAIETVQACAGKDESMFSTVCVHIHPEWVEACDNAQVCRWPLKTGLKESILVRQTAIKHIPALGMTEFSETDGWLHFRNHDKLILSCRRYLEVYRDVGPFLEIKGEPAALPKGLKEACETCEIFSKENTDANKVLVTLRPGKVSVRADGITGGYDSGKLKVRYDGQPLEFLVAPRILMSLTEKHRECEVTENRIKAQTENYVWVSVLTKIPNGKPVEQTEETAEEKPKKKKVSKE